MNVMTVVKRLFLLVALLGLFVATSSSAGAVGTIRYVKPTPAGLTDCSSWANACGLQTALGLAVSGNQIWVAAGTYTPGTASDQFFEMKNGVAIYGGFAGTESALGERNSATYLTVLSGDIDHNDVVDGSGVTTTFNGVNSRNVVLGSGTDSTAVLDGFTVTGGTHGDGWIGGAGVYIADGSPTLSNLTVGGNVIVGDYMYGGGLFTSGGSPSLTNVTFTRNRSGYGGGMSVGVGSPSLKNVVFRGNTAAGIYGGGGALWVDGGSPVLTNVLMSGNKANYGGGMVVYSSGSATLTNVTISGNSVRDNAGGVFVYQGTASLTNSILWGNSAPSGPQIMTNGGSNTATVLYSDVQGGCSSITNVTCGSTNINLDPLFETAVPTSPMPNTGGNLRLTASSPAINAGSNTAITATGVTTDLDGNQRVYPTGGTVDMGAYEYQGTPATTYTVTYDANGGLGTAPTETPKAAGATFTAAPASTFTAPTGKQFKEWNTSLGGTGTAYAAGATVTMPASNLTLYAIWENIATTPVVTTQPQNQRVVVGQTASFTAGATGYSSVQWQVSTDRGASWIDVPSATALTLSFPATIGDNGNRYRAVFTSAAGSTVTNAVSLTVGKANTTASLNSDANPSTNAVTFTATVRAASPGTGTPTGTVTFLEGRTVLATKGLDASGVATAGSISLPVGTHSITAQYSGDASFNGSASNALSQVVNAPAADVGIDITSGTYNSGSKSITWILKVTNVGPATAKAVVVTDTLPKGTKLTNVSGLGPGSYSAKGSTVTIALGDVASGSAATVTLTIDTGLSKTSASGTTFVDTATVSTSSTDNNTANNSATRSLTIP